MSYQVLARKYRSQTFDQMIGQDHISQTLLNALRADRLPHALLFTGIRGTGKTSSARILAKSIRCTDSKNFVPCGVCNSCVEITAGKAMDVIEIDGASNNGVDAIRDLRDNVMFSPSSGKYKIFIIDEVHMLSTSAFNALLKTLEEPPAHVIFIMATTEIQKIPQTILSRCQRFDFRRIPIKQLAAHLKFICEQENIQIQDKALWMIARQGEGSARDSISLLDQVINFSSGLRSEENAAITDAMVSEILGLTSRSLIFGAFQNLIQRDDQAMLALLEKLAMTSVNSALFLDDLIRLFRHAILLKSIKGDAVVDQHIDLPSDEIEILQNLITPLSVSDLHMLFDMCLKSLNDISRSHDPLLVLEISLLRMAQAPNIKDLRSLLSGSGASLPKPEEQTTPLASKMSAQVSPKKPAATTSNTKNFSQKTSAEPLTASASASSSPVSSFTPRVPSSESWFDFVQFLKQTQPILAAKIENVAFGGYDSSNKTLQLETPLVFSFLADQIMQPDAKEKLQGLIDSFFGAGYTFYVQKTKTLSGESALNISQKKEIQAEEKLKDSWAQDSRIIKAQEVFNGKIKIVARE